MNGPIKFKQPQFILKGTFADAIWKDLLVSASDQQDAENRFNDIFKKIVNVVDPLLKDKGHSFDTQNALGLKTE